MNVRGLFSEISGTYDLLNRILSFGADQRWRKKGVSHLPHGDGMRILDLASGTLDLTLQYLKTGKGEVYAVDFALPMLLRGETKLTPNLENRVHLICSDGLKLPFPDGYFDAAMCAFGVRNFSNLKEHLKEMKRVLKPQGSLLILEFFKPTKIWTKLFNNTYERYILPTVGGLFSKNKKAYSYLYRSIKNFCTKQEYLNLLSNKGFQILKTKEFSGGIASLILASKNGTKN